jgi:hypothetical protein
VHRPARVGLTGAEDRPVHPREPLWDVPADVCQPGPAVAHDIEVGWVNLGAEGAAQPGAGAPGPCARGFIHAHVSHDVDDVCRVV